MKKVIQSKTEKEKKKEKNNFILLFLHFWNLEFHLVLLTPFFFRIFYEIRHFVGFSFFFFSANRQRERFVFTSTQSCPTSAVVLPLRPPPRQETLRFWTWWNRSKTGECDGHCIWLVMKKKRRKTKKGSACQTFLLLIATRRKTKCQIFWTILWSFLSPSTLLDICNWRQTKTHTSYYPGQKKKRTMLMHKIKILISRNQGAWFRSGTGSKRDLRLPRLHTLMHRGEIRLQILRYHMMHHQDGSFFFFFFFFLSKGSR